MKKDVKKDVKKNEAYAQDAVGLARERAVSKRWFIVLRSGTKVYETSSWALACVQLLEATEYDDRASLVTFHHVDGQWWLRSVLKVVATQKFASRFKPAEHDALMKLIASEDA